MGDDFKVKLQQLTMIASGQRTGNPNQAGKFRDECYTCKHRREVPGNAHIECVKPDGSMTGHPHGIKEGWFMYPLLFDPTWKTQPCANAEPIDSTAVSRAVSQADQ